MAKRNIVELAFERMLFASRWIVAPMYLGLIATLGMLMVVFAREVADYLPQTMEMTSTAAILMALTLIDLVLTANLLIIVIFSGYENFLSRMDVAEDEKPAWMGNVDFSALKMKLIASIVAISAIALLKRFMEVAEAGAAISMLDGELFWLSVIHLVFVISGVLMALMDWLGYLSRRKPFRDRPDGMAARQPSDPGLP